MTIARKKIIIVDDDRETREMLKMALELEGYDVAQAANGLRLISTLHVDRPDLILLDVMMSWIDGFELCRAVKKNDEFRDIPVIFISAKKTASDIRTGLAAGAADYFSKPIDMERLLTRTHPLPGTAGPRAVPPARRSEGPRRPARPAAGSGGIAQQGPGAHPGRRGHRRRSPGGEAGPASRPCVACPAAIPRAAPVRVPRRLQAGTGPRPLLALSGWPRLLRSGTPPRRFHRCFAAARRLARPCGGCGIRSAPSPAASGSPRRRARAGQRPGSFANDSRRNRRRRGGGPVLHLAEAGPSRADFCSLPPCFHCRTGQASVRGRPGRSRKRGRHPRCYGPFPSGVGN